MNKEIENTLKEVWKLLKKDPDPSPEAYGEARKKAGIKE